MAKLRALEHWLIATGKAHVSADIQRIVQRALE
jgi:hypothetical protein